MGRKEERWRGGTDAPVVVRGRSCQDDFLPLPLPLGVLKEPLPLQRFGLEDLGGVLGVNLTFLRGGRAEGGGAGLLRP